MRYSEFVASKSGTVRQFWLEGENISIEKDAIVDHIDYIYLCALTGDVRSLPDERVSRFVEFVSKLEFAGSHPKTPEQLNPHNTAYVLGALNILTKHGYSVYSKLDMPNVKTTSLIDQETGLPEYPGLLAHHTWRVSHWIGGIPSMISSMIEAGVLDDSDSVSLDSILDSCNARLIDPGNGLLKVYRSSLLQLAFRTLYKLRHNPRHGDIGGLVHLHWVNYAHGRTYPRTNELVDRCLDDLVGADPFLESVPYCLDFDYIQLLRTTSEQLGDYRRDEIKAVLDRYQADLESFLEDVDPNGFSLHKLPGALACLHEIALFNHESKVNLLETDVVDIIKVAKWL